MSSVVTNPIVPPFTRETAVLKVRAAEDAWNSRDPKRVSLAYSVDSRWRNRSEFIHGREEIVAFLTRKWERELDYRLIKELWSFNDNRIAAGMNHTMPPAGGGVPANEMAVRPGRPDAPPSRQYQRSRNQRIRAHLSLAAWQAPRRPSGPERTRVMRTGAA